MEEQNRSFCCEDCKKSYTISSNLYDHIRRSHPDKFKTLNFKRQSVFKCITCEKDYSSKQKLKLHEFRAKHPAIDENSEAAKKKYDCKLCQYTATKSDLMNHIQSSHDIKIKKEILKFSTFKEFEIWKRDIEQTTTSLFIQSSSCKNYLNYKTTIFICNRSGFYECKSTGKRHLKMYGTNKINTYCPAAITLRQKKEECEVEYTKTHFGHKNSLGNVTLSRGDKDELAGKIAAKIPFGVILDKIRENTDTTNVKRIDLLTRRDLHNIQREYNLKSTAIRDASDVTSVEAWVNEVKDTGCVSKSKEDPNNIIDQQTVSNIEYMQGSTSSLNENIQQSISFIDGTRNKRRLSEDSYLPIAKKRTLNKMKDLVSRKTSSN